MTSVLVGNGVNIQFGGKAYTSEFILQRIKYKAKQDKYRELFDNSISGDDIVKLLDGFVDLCNDILNGLYDSLVESDYDKLALHDFKERYEEWIIAESKDIMLEDWFFLLHIFFLKNPDLVKDKVAAIQGFERLVLDAIYNDGQIQKLYKLANKKYKKFIQSFDNIFTINYDNNLELLTGKKAIHLHGDFSVLADSENPETINGLVRVNKNQTVILKNYQHCFCNALLNYSGALKFKRAQDNHKVNIEAETYSDKLRDNPTYFDKIAKFAPEAYELIMTKIEHPELPMATEYHFEELTKIESEIHVIGISPYNDTHIFELINQNEKIANICFYYFSEEEKNKAERIFKSKRLKCINVRDFWKSIDCCPKKYNCNYSINSSKIDIVEICNLFSEYSFTQEQIQKEINTIPRFEMERLTKIVKETAKNQGNPTSGKQFHQYLSEISYIALREGISPPVLFLITIMNF